MPKSPLSRADLPDWYERIPLMVQRQDSESEQMADLLRVAIRLGMYEAADSLRRRERDLAAKAQKSNAFRVIIPEIQEI